MTGSCTRLFRFALFIAVLWRRPPTEPTMACDEERLGTFEVHNVKVEPIEYARPGVPAP